MKFWRKNAAKAIILTSVLWLLHSSCVSHLEEAKSYYTQGQKHSRLSQVEKATAAYKRAIEEAERELNRRPSSQAFTVKGMAALNLGLWREAEESFLSAFVYGFEKGEEWAGQVSLLGLGISLLETGLEETALEVFSYLLDKSKFLPVLSVAAQNYAEHTLRTLEKMEEKEKNKTVTRLLTRIQRLTRKDMSFGYFHYLQSQIYSHLAEYQRSFEEGAMARELGLPSVNIFRDNDRQIIFCFRKLKKVLNHQEWEEFQSLYRQWIEKWNWKDPEIPDWKTR